MADPVHYCTYFDERYLTRGLALYASMRRHCAPFRLWVLCMTEACHRELVALALPDIVPLRLDELESHDSALHEPKLRRSTIEYYFTCTPALMAWLFSTRPEIEILTYLDADLYFFHRPDLLFVGFDGNSTLIIPHRFSARNKQFAKWGIFNVGWVTFRRDAPGLACLGWWRERCLEWCRDVAEPDRFADQKYLDQFPRRFPGVQIDANPGANLAPWNLDNYRVGSDDAGRPLVAGHPVIFFHFHRLRRVTRFLWRTGHYEFGAPLDRTTRQLLYAPYLAELAAAERLLRTARVATPLRRDNRRLGIIFDRLRGITSVLLRGGGIWTVFNRVL